MNSSQRRYQVYFSASSKKLSSKKKQYLKIIDAINHAEGQVVANWLVDKRVSSPKGVFKQAVEGIKGADIVVAEISYSSTGVGQQISYALSLKIPVIALYQKEKRPSSRFTAGFESKLLSLMEYQETSLAEKLKEKIEQVLSSQLVKFNFVSTREINLFLEEKSNALGVSKSQYLRGLIRKVM